MLLRPPRPTLFPTRRSSDLPRRGHLPLRCASAPAKSNSGCRTAISTLSAWLFLSRLAGAAACRSEEHTSELQSLRHLVCRLLLEKKKITGMVDRFSYYSDHI